MFYNISSRKTILIVSKEKLTLCNDCAIEIYETKLQCTQSRVNMIY